jgi:hypothetical protein
MAHTFHLFDLIAILLTAASVAFMVWVFWNLTLQIRREVRTRVAPPETTRTELTAEDRESRKQRVSAGAETLLRAPDAASATSRPPVGTFERRFTSRVVR